MEKLTKEKKNCENCKHYCQHYSKNDTFFSKVNYGHCKNKNIINFKCKPSKICEHWEDDLFKKIERKRRIKEAIVVIANRLDDICYVLKDDEDMNN